jgi:glycosyltransferase involved in cell wall biosynthesis
MLYGKTIAVVVPAFQESKQIAKVLLAVPGFVDWIVVVDDCSTDGTSEVVLQYIKEQQAALSSPIGEDRLMILPDAQEETAMIPVDVLNNDPARDRIILLRNKVNGGVGSAIARGYMWCRDYRVDCTAVMAGDAQMDPSELESICAPVVREGIDYVKGNRLFHRSAWLVIPRVRYIGNSILSLLTKIASGYWHVSDTQTGYTAISLKALNALRLEKIHKRYGMPNDMLVKLNIAYCTIREIEIRPVYNVGEQSKMKIWKVIPGISFLLAKSFFKRLYIKYFFRDFHPLFILYHLAFLLAIIDLPIVVRIWEDTFSGVRYSVSLLILFSVLTISGFQSLLFAMWMDIIDNERLHK